MIDQVKLNLVLLVSLLLAGFVAAAQEVSSVDELFQTKYETPLSMDAEQDLERTDKDDDEEKGKKKEKKVNPKIYYGIKTKRGFAKKGFGNRQTVELFHYLKDKDYVGPDPYARDFYWYDFKKKQIVNSLRVKEDYAGVLHGHYEKKMGDQLLEEGYFYKGMKHGRWVRYNSSDILMEKEIYWKGWPKESRLAYYDFERERLKEIIPVHFGERQGEYYAYHENGNLAVVGHYQYDNKVGIWREYYDNRRVKREVVYPLEPFDKTLPYISKEWDKEGHLIYDRKQYNARVN
ncbi:toxin-antitoxin system YwqK family antitoxin [Marinoscillum sp.]|uniref:toxin-antitoxin system YwqK family antitoxin n=1 Tax=Marinoscillum sp. TaxID=2024838 RepID=UPI003BA869D9